MLSSPYQYFIVHIVQHLLLLFPWIFFHFSSFDLKQALYSYRLLMIFSVAIFTSSSPKAKTWKEAPPKCIPSSPTEICSNPDGQSNLQRKKYIYLKTILFSVAGFIH